MDPVVIVTVLGSFITSISALIIGLATLWTQSKRDSKQAKIDQDKTDKQAEIDRGRLDIERDRAEDEARQATLESLRTELTRLQEKEVKDRARILELEAAELEKIAKIGELMIGKINAESEAATTKYKMNAMQEKMDDMQIKLNAFLPEEAKSRKKKEETVPLAIRQTLETNATRIAKVEEETQKEIETFKSGSLANGEATSVEGE